MAEVATENNGADTQQEFGIQRLYVKDISVESPESPSVFREEWKPEIDMTLNTSTKVVEDDVHEVVLKATVTAKVQEKVAFLIEVQQAGVFTLRHFADEQLHQMLGSYCPNLLFPFLRETVSDLVIRAGFPQLVLAPVNFDALYAQHLQQQKEPAEKVND